MTSEELLKAVREEVEKSGDKQAVETVKALQGFLVGRFPAPANQTKSPGEQFASDAGVQDFVASRAKNTAPIPVKVPGYGLKSGEYIAPRIVGKATIDTTFFPSERTYLPTADFPQRAMRLRDLIPVAGLGTPQIEYARVTGFTNSAGGVAQSGAKPESAIATVLITDSVKTLATFIPVTRQVLRDVPGLQAYVNQVLGYFLQLEEDDQLLNGAGGNDMTGFLQTSGILTQAFSVNKIETVRKAITKLQVAFTSAGFDPTGVVIHPNDWEAMELTKDLDERYILIPAQGTPADGAQPRVWRLPVVVTPAITAGQGLMGAFDIGGTLWTYEDLTLRMTDSHSDWFTKNLIAILAEFRELLAVYFPKAYVDIALA